MYEKHCTCISTLTSWCWTHLSVSGMDGPWSRETLELQELDGRLELRILGGALELSVMGGGLDSGTLGGALELCMCGGGLGFWMTDASGSDDCVSSRKISFSAFTSSLFISLTSTILWRTWKQNHLVSLISVFLKFKQKSMALRKKIYRIFQKIISLTSGTCCDYPSHYPFCFLSISAGFVFPFGTDWS